MQTKLKRLLTLRHAVQGVFVLITMYIGLSFFLFINQLTTSATVTLSRPAGVEGFLPLSALVGFRAWLGTGSFDPVHPAGLVIFLLILLISLIFKRAFCSWICPVGTLSEGLAKLGRMIWGHNFKVPSWLDRILRSLKYLIIAFFLFGIFFGMSGSDAAAFVQSPYNQLTDVLMLRFFERMSIVGFAVLLLLTVLSVLYENFWCRYLCPYGALLGVVSYLSPFKITRNESACIHCGKCTKSCPNRIKVEESKRIFSPECTGCFNCIQQCPVKDTLTLQAPKGLGKLNDPSLAIGIIVIWFAGIIIAKLSGHWLNQITPEAYRQLMLFMGV